MPAQRFFITDRERARQHPAERRRKPQARRLGVGTQRAGCFELAPRNLAGTG
jgi:hypothetical protein